MATWERHVLGIIFIIILVLLVASYVIMKRYPSLNRTINSSCTTEALICPDGTAVGRTGPRCEFAPCANLNVGDLPPAPATGEGSFTTPAE